MMEISPRSQEKIWRMDASQVPVGMDPATTFKLKIWSSSPNCRKEMTYTIIMYVDKKTTNYKDFVDEYGKEQPWGLNECLQLSYFRSDMQKYVTVTNDKEMMDMFSACESSKYIELNAFMCPLNVVHSVSANTENAPQDVSESTVPDMSCNQPTHSSQPSLCETSYLVNPFPMNEHVGVNEEVMYGVNVVDVTIPSTNVVVDKEVQHNSSEGGESSDSEDNSEGGESDDGESSENEESSDGGQRAEGGERDEGGGRAEDGESAEGAEEWVVRDVMPDFMPCVAYDKEDPPMTVGSIYPSLAKFRIALSQHVIKNEREFNFEKSDKERVRVYCSQKAKGCKWRLHASTLQDNVTAQVKVNPYDHTFSSRRRSKKMKHATSAWICEQVLDWLREDPCVGAKELQRRIKEKYNIQVKYKRVHSGRVLALENVYGKWHDSFDMLYRWKAEVLRRCPGSVIIIDYHPMDDKNYFSRIFVALKACVDGFLGGCRPYLAIDSTFLTGMFKGQLATACGVDAHNWLFPVTFAVMECESGDNWKWFMERLHDVVRDPPGLAICTDAGKGLITVKDVFKIAEHTECMRHLVTNFKKRFHGKVYHENLWPAAYAWQLEKYEEHMEKMRASNSEVQSWIDQHHPNLWMRSKFSTITKVDYVTNNLAESFNNWINKIKALNIVDLMDTLRQMLMIKFDQRCSVAKSLNGVIMPHVISELNAKSFDLKYDVLRNGEYRAEVSGRHWTFTRQLENFRHRSCTCREWQLTGKPCLHAIAFITSLNEDIENYVDHYYSVEKFKATYAGRVPACVDKNQWPKSDHGFFLYSPLLRKVAGRPRTLRIKGSHEPGAGTKKKGTAHQCLICKGFRHHWKNCKEGDPAAKEALAILAARMKAEKKRATKKAMEKALASIRTPSTTETLISTSKSVCSSNEVEAPGPLAIVHVPADSVAGTSAIRKKNVKKPSEEISKKTVKKSKKGAATKTKEKKGNDGAAAKEGKKRCAAAATNPSTPKKRKKTSVETSPSTPTTSSKRTPVAVPHDSPAMGTRGKMRERSLSDLLAR